MTISTKENEKISDNHTMMIRELKRIADASERMSDIFQEMGRNIKDINTNLDAIRNEVSGLSYHIMDPP